jgi:hypothetical protein
LAVSKFKVIIYSFYVEKYSFVWFWKAVVSDATKISSSPNATKIGEPYVNIVIYDGLSLDNTTSPHCPIKISLIFSSPYATVSFYSSHIFAKS